MYFSPFTNIGSIFISFTHIAIIGKKRLKYIVYIGKKSELHCYFLQFAVYYYYIVLFPSKQNLKFSIFDFYVDSVWSGWLSTYANTGITQHAYP